MTVLTKAQCIQPAAVYSSNQISNSMVCASGPGKDSCQVDLFFLTFIMSWRLKTRGRSLFKDCGKHEISMFSIQIILCILRGYTDIKKKRLKTKSVLHRGTPAGHW